MGKSFRTKKSPATAEELKNNNKTNMDSGLYSTSESEQEDLKLKSKLKSESSLVTNKLAATSSQSSTSKNQSQQHLEGKNNFETILKLRREIESLKEQFTQTEKNWSQERNVLLEELIRRQDYPDLSTDIQVLEAQRVRLTLLEEKIKEVLNMLRSLNNMNISSKTLGKLVLEAVERAVDPLSGEVQVFKFLNELYLSARDYERMSTENQIHLALKAVEEHSKTLARMEDDNRQKTLRFRHTSPTRNIYKIDI